MLKHISYPFLALGLLIFCNQALAAGVTPIVAKAETPNYRLDLDIGHTAHMYTKAQVATLHPTEGEIMVSGKMVSMASGSAAGSVWRHLELHVYSKATGEPVKGANVHISLTNMTTQQSQTVPISVMYGIREGKTDWHYGNNVLLHPGKYRVDVSVNGESAMFNIVVPGT